MKKTLGLLISIILVSGFFVGCGSSNNGDSPYLESWYKIEGYVVNDENGKFVEFVEGTKNKPAETPIAYKYEHRYKDNPPTYVLTPQKWNEANIIYEDIEKSYRYSFSKTPLVINDLIFYCDNERVIVINNKYKDYRDKERRDDDEYRFKIRVYSIADELDFKMVKNSSAKW